MSLTNLTPPAVAEYNDTTYQCTQIDVYGTSQHAYDGVFQNLEMVAIFTNGSSTILVSIPVAVSGATGTPSARFFNKFAGYTASPGAIPMGVSLGDAVPSNMSYFVYSGRTFFGACTPVTWVVYNQASFISTSDYGILQGVLTNTYRKPLQQLSPPGNPNERHVSYRDVREENPAYLQPDGRVYMKCRRLNTSGEAATGDREKFTLNSTIEGLDNPTPEFSADGSAKPARPSDSPVDASTRIQSGGVIATARAEAADSVAMQAKNVWGSIVRFFQGFGVLGAILMILEVALAVALQTTWRETPENIFKYMIFVPNVINAYLFSPYSSLPKSSSK
ncbi:MAG: hypothetical protein ACOYOI_10125 [Chthoniobacterales bacterium]